MNSSSLEDIEKKRDEMGFVEKSRKVEEECRTCEYGYLCRGGCRRDREDFSSGELGKTYLCEAYKDFFAFALDGLKTMAREELRARKRAGV